MAEGKAYDDYGNEIEGEFIYCSYPNCGCDGARLCMAKNGASERASQFNIEGMYSMKGKAGARARMNFLTDIHKNG